MLNRERWPLVGSHCQGSASIEVNDRHCKRDLDLALELLTGFTAWMRSGKRIAS